MEDQQICNSTSIDMRRVEQSQAIDEARVTDTIKQARYAFYMKYKDKDLEWWKNVIWTDEISVILGHRQGGYRVWRKKEERYDPTCVRPSYEKASDFMFWGCFSYHKKGPCHIYLPETAQQKK